MVAVLKIIKIVALLVPYFISRPFWALKAFGSLLASSNMEDFCGDNEHADGWRFGLGQIIVLYIENQERQPKALCF